MAMRTKRFLVAGAAAALLAVSACSSSGGSSTSSTPAGSAASTGSSSSSSGSGSSQASADVAAATANLTNYDTQPTSIGLTTPLAKKPTGKVVDFVECGLDPCQEVGTDFTAAMKLLGVTVKIVPAGLTPESYQAGFAQAIQNKPDAVVSTAISAQTVSTQLNQLNTMNIPVLISAISGAPHSALKATPFGDPVSTEIGKIGADWLIKDGGGQNINVLDLTFPVFDFEGPQYAGFSAEFKAHCVNCSIHEIVAQPTDIGQALPTEVVNYLQAHPDVKYVWGSFGGALQGISQALKVAGITGVTLFSQGGTQLNLGEVTSGAEAATILVSFNYLSWVVADETATLLTGGSIANISDASLPWFYIVTKSNLNFNDNTDPEGPGPANFQAQFEKLWGV
jgi:ABC-type sugar transport system substrate-binding protein